MNETMNGDRVFNINSYGKRYTIKRLGATTKKKNPDKLKNMFFNYRRSRA